MYSASLILFILFSFRIMNDRIDLDISLTLTSTISLRNLPLNDFSARVITCHMDWNLPTIALNKVNVLGLLSPGLAIHALHLRPPFLSCCMLYYIKTYFTPEAPNTTT